MKGNCATCGNWIPVKSYVKTPLGRCKIDQMIGGPNEYCDNWTDGKAEDDQREVVSRNALKKEG